MVIIEVITLEIPFSDICSPKQIMKCICNGELPSAFERIMDDEVKSFLMKMIAHDYKDRKNIEELLQDDFLKITKEDNRIIKVKSAKRMKKKKKSVISNNSENIPNQINSMRGSSNNNNNYLTF